MKPVFVLLILALGGLFKQLGGIAWQVFGGVFLLTRYEKSEWRCLLPSDLDQKQTWSLLAFKYGDSIQL